MGRSTTKKQLRFVTAAAVVCFCLLIMAAADLVAAAWSFAKTGNNGATSAFTVNGVAAGPYNPANFRNWVYDIRFPLMSPQGNGACRNIYAANVVNNGPGCYNIYFGGWDGVASCHDSVSVAVTETNFATINPHYPQIATGSMMHVNNPSTFKHPTNGQWYMAQTQLPYAQPPRNKPGFSQGPDGIHWDPNSGGDDVLAVSNYSDWDNADVNGGNVIFIDTLDNTFHLYFVDFQNVASGSVFHATANFSWAFPPVLEYQGVLVSSAQGIRIVNDLKKVGTDVYLMALHCNGQQVFVSSSSSPSGPFSIPQPIFGNLNADDFYIVSISLVVDDSQQRVLGALYGASSTSSLDTNNIYAAWLQRRVLFKSVDNTTVMGLGAASRSQGPDQVILDTNSGSMSGRFFLYDADFDPQSNDGTLLHVSEVVLVVDGDVWQLSQ